MKRVVLIVLGVLLLLIATPLLTGGVFLASWSSGEEPMLEGRIGRVDSLGYAVVSDRIETDWQWPFADRWDITLAVENSDSDIPVFFGYGPAESVDAYLAGSPHTVVYSIGSGDSIGTGDVEIPGSEAPSPPGEQDFWVQQADGFGRQEIALVPEQGDYRFVAMNADATAGVSLAVYGSMQLPFLFPLGTGMAVAGGLVAILGIVLLVLGIRAEPAPKPVQAGQYPGYGQQGYGYGPGYPPPGAPQAGYGQAQHPPAQYPQALQPQFPQPANPQPAPPAQPPPVAQHPPGAAPDAPPPDSASPPQQQ